MDGNQNAIRRLVFSASLIFVIFQAACAEVSGPKSLAYVLQADSLAKNKAAAVQRLAASGRDWIVLDAGFSGNVPWTRADLKAIRSARAGRRIICYVSIV